MYISEVSKRTGASPKAIRLYEELKLIPVPERKNKYRFYTDQHIELIKFIKHAQQYGFKLSELKEFISTDFSCEDIPRNEIILFLQERIKSNENQIEELTTQNSLLKNSLEKWRKNQL